MANNKSIYDVYFEAGEAEGGYRASLSFFVVNTPERVEVETFLERLR